ncbi:MAG: Asp-tRNA(Asn)/Glu-tRNA(Gln) amidotransferase GatCAB subunit C [Chlorobiaceae bacterium]|nr:Asp-tRNA(Asn)/Glu-tRNA(Gln) amidotransferase GatCAB subunit C [Chlorobiaceae bacterium]MBA4309977.1 Asp-tRNA(Asn)/Glu-tRNA(Gln) amidotransferase GatCAB subunit C [Chlorobiaceae bacterium]
MSVTINDVKHISELAKLKFSDVELNEFTNQLNEILGYVEKLNELDTSNVEPLSYPVEMTNVFREDEATPSTPREIALLNSEDADEKYFRVPKVINQD